MLTHFLAHSLCISTHLICACEGLCTWHVNTCYHHHRYLMQRRLDAIHRRSRPAGLALPAALAAQIQDIFVDTPVSVTDQCMDRRVRDAEILAPDVQTGIAAGIRLFLSSPWAFHLGPGHHVTVWSTRQTMIPAGTLRAVRWCARSQLLGPAPLFAPLFPPALQFLAILDP